MSIDLDSPFLELLLTENQMLRTKCNELCETIDGLQSNAVVIGKFIKSIYDFSGNIPSFASTINISTYDSSCNIISCVTSDEYGIFTPCADVTNHNIPCVLPPDLSGNRSVSIDRSHHIPYWCYPYDYHYYQYPYYLDYLRYSYGDLLNDDEWRGINDKMRPLHPSNSDRSMDCSMNKSRCFHYPYDYHRRHYYYGRWGDDYWRGVNVQNNASNNTIESNVSNNQPNHMSIHPSSRDIELPNLEQPVNKNDSVNKKHCFDYPYNYPYDYPYDYYRRPYSGYYGYPYLGLFDDDDWRGVNLQTPSTMSTEFSRSPMPTLRRGSGSLQSNVGNNIQLKHNESNNQPNHMSIHPSSRDIEMPNLEQHINNEDMSRNWDQRHNWRWNRWHPHHPWHGHNHPWHGHNHPSHGHNHPSHGHHSHNVNNSHTNNQPYYPKSISTTRM